VPAAGFSCERAFCSPTAKNQHAEHDGQGLAALHIALLPITKALRVSAPPDSIDSHFRKGIVDGGEIAFTCQSHQCGCSDLYTVMRKILTTLTVPQWSRDLNADREESPIEDNTLAASKNSKASRIKDDPW
jgi:hypothetical protein